MICTNSAITVIKADDDDDDDVDCLILTMIVAPYCARCLCSLVLGDISIAHIHGNKH